MAADYLFGDNHQRVEFKMKLARCQKELERQAQADGPSPYADCDNPEDAVLDGHFNLEHLVLAIIGIHPDDASTERGRVTTE